MTVAVTDEPPFDPAEDAPEDEVDQWDDTDEQLKHLARTTRPAGPVDLRAVRDERIPPWVPPITEPIDLIANRVLHIENLRDVACRVANAPTPRWLARPLVAEDSYGILAAEDKAGKTWAQLDLAISVAAGHAWLGLYPCDAPGPVLQFLGEGGERKMIRRVHAIAATKGLDVDELPMRLCHRVPHLTNKAHLEEIRRELECHPASLVIVDPLYLAARGAKGSDLYEMGAHLETVQHVCQQVGAALLVVTHFNKTGTGKGAERITGVGPGAWGRFLFTANVEHRRTEPAGATVVVLAWQLRGDEIPDTDLTLRRRIWADNPDDLTSPLHYELEQVEPDQADEESDLTPAQRRILGVLQTRPEPTDVTTLGDILADDGKPLKRRTIQDALARLEEIGLADSSERGPGVTARWWSTDDPEVF